MLHMITCKNAKALWKVCIDFCKKVLGEPSSQIDPTYAIILGVHRPSMKLLSEPTRAFLRHAFGIYYRDVVNVAKHNTLLIIEKTFHGAVKSFHTAVLRYAYAIRLLYIRRIYTNLTEEVPEDTRLKYEPFLKVRSDGTFLISQTFTDVMQEAAQKAEIRVASNQTRS